MTLLPLVHAEEISQLILAVANQRGVADHPLSLAVATVEVLVPELTLVRANSRAGPAAEAPTLPS